MPIICAYIYVRVYSYAHVIVIIIYACTCVCVVHHCLCGNKFIAQLSTTSKIDESRSHACTTCCVTLGAVLTGPSDINR